MKQAVLVITLSLFAVPVTAYAQDVTIPANIERLAAKASDTVNITIDGALLQLAAKFLSNEPEEQGVKRLIGKIKGIYVRSFVFNQSGEYTDADVESLRAQVRGPQWSRMASVRSQRQGEDVDVFLNINNDQIGGLVVIAAKPRELTFVNIVGPIDLDSLARMGGQFGIPRLNVPRGK